MKILLTGSHGQLGNSLRLILEQHQDIEAIYTDIDTLDICNEAAVKTFIAAKKPDVLINCAAYTAVDKAEDDIATATKVNVTACTILATACEKQGVQLISVSTDYVFDGTSHIPYTEDRTVCPTNVYGRTKLEGEREIQRLNPSAVIVRTSWLYSAFGNNFVKTMLKLSETHDQLKVIFDQVGTPTYAMDLAQALISIAQAKTIKPGIFHFSNEGACSWYDFTQMIFALAHIPCKVLPITSDQYPVKTPRPHYSILDKTKIKQTYGLEIPYWLDGLERCLKQLQK